MQLHCLSQLLVVPHLDGFVFPYVTLYQINHPLVRINHQDRRGLPIPRRFFHRTYHSWAEQGNVVFWDGKRESEGRAYSLLALHPDPTVVSLHKVFAYCETQASPPVSATQRLVYLIELVGNTYSQTPPAPELASPILYPEGRQCTLTTAPFVS